tara:strand:+ start:50 stop:313 length:264 start_codon:yes stop_codon:yes gene_type:complete
MREYQVKIQRTYTTYVILKFPDDGKNHKLAIEDNLTMANELDEGDIWSLIAEKELEQMDVDNETWEISEINNNTITGALSNDTGPRN